MKTDLEEADSNSAEFFISFSVTIH
jgi:hypothetical protein